MVRQHKSSDRSFRTGEAFKQYIGRTKINIEACLAQAVGRVRSASDSCRNCQLKNGPFSACVDVPGIMEECANCHVAGHRLRCSLLRSAATPMQNQPEQFSSALASNESSIPEKDGPIHPSPSLRTHELELHRLAFDRVMEQAMHAARNQGESDIFEACHLPVSEIVFGVKHT